ncbi:cytochrome c oxidase assembly factor Coa1 family protein [Flavobacterium sp. ZB4P13]|uniref:cytochrome c oxidase assembly factor Coa1 family protein n=1 Tax=Flavobacterium sp. ZB4P13 TaxID=3401728 RepID=UPI003AAF90A1
MDNELIVEKSWWKKNWKWFLPTALFLIGTVLFTSLSIDGDVTDIAKAYSENSLYEKAIEKSKTNKRVLQLLGNLKPIDKLAIIEGNAKYSNNNNSIELTVRVKGSKGKGKMDISADKKGAKWKYKKISIRIKHPEEEIKIINDTI